VLSERIFIFGSGLFNEMCGKLLPSMHIPKARLTPAKTLGVLLILIATSSVEARQSAPSGLTIQQAVQTALQNYPAITVTQEQIDAAAAGIQLARTAYLPKIDSLAQVNRATRNNVFGLLLPQAVIPSISGPVLGSNNAGSVWGSALGALVTWEPFDFGLRQASVSAATASKTRSESTLKRTQFDVSVAAADAFLTLVAAQEMTRAAQAGVERAQSVLQIVRAQAEAQLRPGADTSHVDAQLAAARTQLAQAEQAESVARALLSQFVGIPPQQIAVAATKLLQLPPEQAVLPLDVAKNPIAAEQNAVIDQKKAELQVLEKSYVPRLFTQASAYARGTGARLDGTSAGGLNGLAPDTQNYALGFTVTFPVFDFAAIRARQAGQAASVRAETARYQQITTELTARRNAAAAALEGSRKIAANTPVVVSAATTANQQATARYQAGLGTIVEVADTQRLVTQAEIDDSLARLGVWRALLSVAAATGDIQPFLTSATR
jgi:outer membrane protein TolC